MKTILLHTPSQLPRLPPHGFHLKFELIINGIWYCGFISLISFIMILCDHIIFSINYKHTNSFKLNILHVV
jgi:hypothetical protein